MMTRREALVAMMGAMGLAATEVYGASRVLAETAPNPAGGTELSAADVALLNEVAETILPTTPDSPGAKAAGVGEFMREIVRDYYDADERTRFLEGLAQFRSLPQESKGGFPKLDPAEREEFLLTLENDESAAHYQMIKQLTVWGYFTSEVGTKQALRFAPIPGRYDGDVTIEPGTKAWAQVAGV